MSLMCILSPLTVFFMMPHSLHFIGKESTSSTDGFSGALATAAGGGVVSVSPAELLSSMSSTTARVCVVREVLRRKG